MYRKKTVYIGFGTCVSVVSGIHWESWDVSPKDKGGLLYREHLMPQTELYFIDHAAHMHAGTREHTYTPLCKTPSYLPNPYPLIGHSFFQQT